MISIYRTAEAIPANKMARVKAKLGRKADFRISRPHLGKEADLFNPGSKLRKNLAAKIGKTSLTPFDVHPEALIAMQNADSTSIVARSSNFIQGTLLISLLVSWRAEMEYLLAKTRFSSVYLIKGKDERDENGNGYLSVNSPFIPKGPTIHNHPGEDASPSVGDFATMMYQRSPFTLIVGREKDFEGNSVIMVNKCYFLGPIRVVEQQQTSTSSTDIFKTLVRALTTDGFTSSKSNLFYNPSRSNSLPLSGKHKAAIPDIIDWYKEDMKKHGERIQKLEKELYPDPSKNVELATELAELYIETQYYFNAFLLIGKLEDKGVKNDKIDHLLAIIPGKMPEFYYGL